jgi:molybdopterin-guanine dinucleotide biosynthesis protein A
MSAHEDAGRGVPGHDAIVLAGGQGRRLGSITKAEVLVAGRPLLDHVLDAASSARAVVVVGPEHLARPGVPTVMEHPPSGGPVAGIDAGLTFLGRADGEPTVLVLACDVPRAAGAVPRLLAALADHPSADGAHLVDEGHAQLVALYRRPALAAALDRLAAAGGVHGVAVRRLLEGLVMVPVDDPDGHGADADTWEDVERLDSLIARSEP